MSASRDSGGRRIAVVLFNLGGPDGPESVKPFLFNLFNDPAIIGLPGVLRTALARLISGRRETSAQANYAYMGGGSPLLPGTKAQAVALEQVLSERLPADNIRAFVCMRYWHPMTEAVAAEVEAWQPDEIVLLPLYPQFSTTTTASSLKLWQETYGGPGSSRIICCYPQAGGWIEAQAGLVREGLKTAGDQPVRVLFSAHGIPESLVTKKGDPYAEQVEAGCRAVAERLGLTDWSLCYQSRVGPMKWLGPSTPEALEQAGRDGVGVVLVPIAFVSEHIETLVELDIEYRELAEEHSIHPYIRVPTVSVTPAFIAGLAEGVLGALDRTGTAPFGPGCQADWKACPCRAERRAGAVA
ncbi:ferrochelatase [Brevundimonas sp.]|uniref:ferrochelatase n=1 Tax=Brevundimonas sp. TaxID=1871086 RepID=UPI003AF6FE53